MANAGIIILQAIYLFLPVAFANMAPVFSKKIFKWMAKPVDFGATFRGKRVFGQNKTIRGFVMAYIYALIIVFDDTFSRDKVSL